MFCNRLQHQSRSKAVQPTLELSERPCSGVLRLAIARNHTQALQPRGARHAARRNLPTTNEECAKHATKPNQGFVCNTATSSRFHCIAVVGLTGRNQVPPAIANPISPKKKIGQKKAIRQSQIFRNYYDDAIEVLLKFCGGAIKVL